MLFISIRGTFPRFPPCFSNGCVHSVYFHFFCRNSYVHNIIGSPHLQTNAVFLFDPTDLGIGSFPMAIICMISYFCSTLSPRIVIIIVCVCVYTFLSIIFWRRVLQQFFCYFFLFHHHHSRRIVTSRIVINSIMIHQSTTTTGGVGIRVVHTTTTHGTTTRTFGGTLLLQQQQGG